MKVSVVMATYNRAELLNRSLTGYWRAIGDDREIIIVDDWSSDKTEAVVRSWADRMNIVYIRPPYKTPGTWRDATSIINIGLRAAQGELIIAAHPEIIPGNESIQLMWEQRQPKTWHVCKPYFLTPNQQLALDDVPWSVSNTFVRELPTFYSEHVEIDHGGNTYDHAAVEKAVSWDSWQFAGALRETWQLLGGMYPFKTWGSADMWLYTARQHHGIINQTLIHPESLVIHQNHDAATKSTPKYHDLFKTLEGIPLTAQELW